MSIQAKCEVPVHLHRPIQTHPCLSTNYSRLKKNDYILSSYTQNDADNLLIISFEIATTFITNASVTNCPHSLNLFSFYPY
jgi:hypothetical protein